jgi:tetratricopeptide (TPR) repeat protein
MAQTWRIIRVFISSTFRDMQAEREELVKRIFPQLRKLCEQRGVIWGEVDLRWGVTDEQKAEGKVLPICLEEIQRCRPYFIGLLGERYGWVPDEIPQDLVQREPWLAQYHHHSVTELEILHGVLNNPDMAEHAFFYLRSPTFIDSLPAEERAQFREEPTRSEIEKLGTEVAKRRTDERKQNLVDLKERIRASGFPVRDGYKNPRSLGELVLKDLTAVIDRIFPAGSQPDSLDRESVGHEAFAASRAQVYIERKEYFERLDEHAESSGPPLVVLGESGGGKSALLANWALQYRENIKPKDTLGRTLLLMHFTGASPYSTDWAAMLRRIMGEFKRHFDIRDDVPDHPDELRAAFANWLHMVAARGRVILILDGLNQLEDRDGAPDLVWLPPHIPESIRLILSTLPGRPLDELKKRGWPVLDVAPLDETERQKLITQYLGLYRKSLNPAQVERIAKIRQAANPLYLRVLLEELRLYGDHATLNERIDYYLAADTVGDLYGKVLRRYEEDYERDRPGLVGDAMSLLWAARWGLSDVELLELLGSDGEPLPHAQWSPLYLAAESSLVSRSGFIGFGHDFLRQAVRDRFLPNERERQTAHLRLAGYFGAGEPGRRKMDELPWQLAQADAWQRLYDLLSSPEFFMDAWRADQFEVKAYWTQVEANSSLRVLEAYQPALDAPDRNPDLTWPLATMLADMGYSGEALKLRAWLVDHFRRTGDKGSLEACLGNQAISLKDMGELDAAIPLLKEQEQICRELNDHDGLRACLGSQSLILYIRGELDAAMALHKEEERICRELGNKDGLGISLGNQALILQDRGELDAAMALYKEEERICRELGNKDGLERSSNNQALILLDRGDLDGAMALLKESERLCRELGRKHGIAACLNNEGLILRNQGNLDGALALHEEAQRLYREVGYKKGLSATLGDQSLTLADQGDLSGAITLLKEQERLCREMGDKAGLAVCMVNQAVNMLGWRTISKAIVLIKESERLFRELGDKLRLAECLYNEHILLEKVRKDTEAFSLLNESLALREQVLGPDHPDVAICLNAIACSLSDQSKYEEALHMLERALSIRERALGPDDPEVAMVLNNMANAYSRQKNYARALPLYERAVKIAESTLATDDLNRKSYVSNLKRCRKKMR